MQMVQIRTKIWESLRASTMKHTAELALLHGGAHHCMIEAREEGSRKTAVRFACLLGSLAAFRRLYTCSMSIAPASAARQAHAQALALCSAQLQNSALNTPKTPLAFQGDLTLGSNWHVCSAAKPVPRLCS